MSVVQILFLCVGSAGMVIAFLRESYTEILWIMTAMSWCLKS
jgi:hypothetical protein